MPTYQYACTECEHGFEAVQSFSDDALTECPVCSGRLRKIFSAVGIVFKGSGFYRNDSREPAKGSGDVKPEKTEKPDKPEKVTADKGGGEGVSKSDRGDKGDRGSDKKPASDSSTAGSSPKAKDSGGAKKPSPSSSSSTAGSAA